MPFDMPILGHSCFFLMIYFFISQFLCVYGCVYYITKKSYTKCILSVDLGLSGLVWVGDLTQ